MVRESVGAGQRILGPIRRRGNMTDREKFEAKLQQTRASGLLDLKYFFRPTQPMTPEEIYRAMNEFDEASKTGRRHLKWKGNTADTEVRSK
jgi:hypothetical protein